MALADLAGSGALGALQKLFLNNNKIGGAGMTAFSSAIANGALTQLQSLSLSENQISEAGMVSFSTAIAGGALPSVGFLPARGACAGGRETGGG